MFFAVTRVSWGEDSVSDKCAAQGTWLGDTFVLKERKRSRFREKLWKESPLGLYFHQVLKIVPPHLSLAV